MLLHKKLRKPNNSRSKVQNNSRRKKLTAPLQKQPPSKNVKINNSELTLQILEAPHQSNTAIATASAVHFASS
jgi:hypothetical protein